MTQLELTRHAEMRCQQRGVPESDVSLIIHYGTDTGDGWLLTKSDCQEYISELKATIEQLEKLKKREVFVPKAENRAKSVYPISKTKRQRIRQHGGFR